MAQPRESTEPNEPNDDDETLSAAACLKETLTKLKPEYGTLLRQVYLEEISIKEVAKSEQLTSNNAAVRIHRARSALRQAMRHQCKTCAVEDCWARHRLAALSAPTVAINPEAAPDIACKYSIQPFEKRNHYAN